jgi:type II secretory pathway pseudopilin PulG
MKRRGQSSSSNQQLPAGQQSQSGFTIMETLIVFAIAGMILLIVLFAIPALQRNSRNNQRRQDVQSILGAVSHWQLNHSGNIPASGDNYLQAAKAKLTIYDAGNIIMHGNSSGDPDHINPANNLDKVDINNYQKCSTTALGGSTATGAGYSDIVALYVIETSNGIAGKCQQL